jgi:class 3 adenylate cyclase/tetratricopeptide (TPR) repeat protein
MDVGDWLRDLELEQYAEAFARNDIDADTLPRLTAQDLSDIGVRSVGHRRKLLDAIDWLAAIETPALPSPASGAEPEAERRHVTVVFADLSGFTQLSNELGAERTHALLNRYFAVVDGIIADYGGSIDKHIGDNVMAVFGAPVAHGDDTERAVRAAFDIHPAMRALSASEGRELKAHIGIASGQVVASGTGSESHREYTVTGETVNLASRLQDKAGPGETLISDTVRRTIADIVDCVDLGEIDVKGFDAPTRVWRTEKLSHSTANRVSRPFVGRRPQLRQFQAIIEECLETGTGQALVVRGEAGIGKTRLVEEFARIAAVLGFANHRSSVLDFGVGKGQDAIRILVRSLLGVPVDGSETMRQEAADSATGDGTVQPDQRAFLNDLLDLPQAGELRSMYDAMENSTRNAGKRQTLSRLICRASCRQPIMITIEDVHWANRPMLAHLASIASTVATCPALLLMTCRVEGDPIDQSWRASLHGSPLTTIDLGPIHDSEAIEIARHLLGTASPFVQSCIARAEGNPLFLEQLLRNNDRSLSEQIPATIQSLVQAEVDRLEPPDKRALQAASIFGQHFSSSALVHLLDVPAYDCELLVRRILVRPSGEGLAFTHALIRDAVYDSLLQERRHELHRRAAEWYAGRDPVLRAEHLDRAEAAEAAAAYFEAAESEAAAFRLEHALALTDRAYCLAGSPQARLRPGMLRAELMRELGRVQEAKEAFRQLLTAASQDIHICRVWIGIASCVRLLGGYSEGVEALDTAEPLAHRNDAYRELAQIAYYRGCLLFATGNIEGCLAQHQHAREYAERINDPEWEARALSGLGDAYYGQGRMRLSIEHFRRCSALCRQEAFGKIEVGSIHMIGVVRRYLNEFREAIDDLRDAARTANEVGNARTEMVALTLLGELLVDADELDAAYDALDKSLAITERFGNRRYRAYLLYERGRALWHDEHRRHEAVPTLRKALDTSRGTDITFVGPRILAALALATSEKGNAWRELLDEGEQVLRSGCIAHNALWYYRDAIEAALNAGDWDLTERYATEFEIRTSSEPLPWASFFIARARVLVAVGQRRRDDETNQKLNLLYKQGEQVGIRAALPALARALATA